MDITQEELEQLADGLNPTYIRKEWKDVELVIMPLAKMVLGNKCNNPATYKYGEEKYVCAEHASEMQKVKTIQFVRITEKDKPCEYSE